MNIDDDLFSPEVLPSSQTSQNEVSESELLEEIKRLTHENKMHISLLKDFRSFHPLNDDETKILYDKIIEERDQMIDYQKNKIENYKKQLEVIKSD